MKSVLLVFLFIITPGCKSDSIPTEKIQETVSISGEGTLEFLLSTAIPIEGGFSIAQQAEHFAVSEIQYQDKGIFYVYKPIEGFKGTDLVKLKREDSNGAKIFSQTITTLNIKVKD